VARRRSTVFWLLYLPVTVAGYHLLTPETSGDFTRVAKDFRVMAVRDGKPVGMTLSALAGRDASVTFLLPPGGAELPDGDTHKAKILEAGGTSQLIEYEYSNTISSVSRYLAFRDRVEPVSYRLTFHPALPIALVVLMLPAWLAAFLIDRFLLSQAIAAPAVKPAAQAAAPKRPLSRLDYWLRAIALGATCAGFLFALAMRFPQAISWSIGLALVVAALYGGRKLMRSAAGQKPEARPSRLTWVVTGLAVATATGLVVYAAMPRQGEYLSRHKVAEAVLSFSSARSRVDAFYAKHERLPVDAAEADLGAALGAHGRVREMRYRDGELTAVITNVAPELDGKSLHLKARAAGGRIEWTCYSRDVPDRHLPKICRPQ